MGIVTLTVAGTIQVVINMPKEAIRNALPTIAGLKMLEPSPPKTIFPIATAKLLPITATQKGKAGGSDKARITPVTTALKSPREFGCLRIRLQSHSVATAEITQAEIRIRA